MTRYDAVKYSGFYLFLSTPISVKSTLWFIIVSSLHPLSFAQFLSSFSPISLPPCWFFPIYWFVCLFLTTHFTFPLLVPPDPLSSPPSIPFPSHSFYLPSHPYHFLLLVPSDPLSSPPSIPFPLHGFSP